MQMSHELSTNNAQSDAKLTTGPGNGLPSQSLRQDVIKLHDWPLKDYNQPNITDNPVKHVYKVQSDCMIATRMVLPDVREMVLPNDELKVEVIPLERLVPGKLYVITDHAGNVYLSRIKEFNPGQSLRLKFLNQNYPDVILRRNDIATVAMCYERSTGILSNEAMDFICSEYPYDGKGNYNE